MVELIKFLLKKPGYLKKSLDFVNNTLKSEYTEDQFLQAKHNVRLRLKSSINNKKRLKKISKNIKNYNPEEHILSPIEEIRKVNIITSKNYDINNTLAIADMHEPFCKVGYLEHCMEIRDKYKCGRIVLIGDEVDLCGVSQWEKDPDGFSAGTEAELAQQKMKVWYLAFPTAYVCIGNHTARPFRQAKANGIPKKFIKSYEEAWEAPLTWKWAESWEFNNVHYTHGTGYSGPNAAIRIATRHRQNTVIGHIHSEAGIQYSASKIDLVWGMQLGGALDDSSYAAHYAKDQLKKSIIGCGVVLNGELPIYEPMRL